MSKSIALLLVVACALSMSSAFAPKAQVSPMTAFARPITLTRTYINIGDQERDKLTRDSEPEDYFKT